MRGIEVAQDQIGIRHRGHRAATPIAGGAGGRAGAFRANMQNTAAIHMRDGAATGPQSYNIQAVQRHPVPADGSSAHQSGFAVDNQGNIRAGAAHIERDQVRRIQQPRGIAAAGNATGRAR